MNKKKIGGLGTGIILTSIIIFSLTLQEEVPVEDNLASNDSIGKNSRLLGIAINEGKNTDYITAIEQAKELGVDFVPIALTWDMIEMSPNQYNDEFLDLINWMYSSQDIEIMLQIAPIEHRVNRMAPDLKEKPFDDPEVILRFNKMIDYFYEKTPDIKIMSMAIGSEIDAHMDTPERWNAYESFYKQVTEHIKNKERWKDIPIGVKTMFTGITEQHINEIMSINKHSDVIMVTYYPLASDFTFRDPSDVDADMQLVIEKAGGKPIYFLEVGYSSGNVVKSSPEKQKRFVIEVFKAWDKHAEYIRAINFVWMHDVLDEDVLHYNEYYGTSDPKFSNYLGTLGLKHNDGKPKNAWITLEEESEKRGWERDEDTFQNKIE